MKSILSHLGIDVVLAQDGAEAIKFYTESLQSQAPIDLMIMDLTIPGGIGGKEANRKILALNPEAKIIVTSGYSNDPVMADYQKFGFCAAIVKPLLIADIKNAITPFLFR